VKNWFQSFAFKFNLCRYSLVQKKAEKEMESVMVGACSKLNAVDP
jgi:hypothetical protein